VQLLVNAEPNGTLNVNWSMVYSTTTTSDKDLIYAHAYDKKNKELGLDKIVRNPQHALRGRRCRGDAERQQDVGVLRRIPEPGVLSERDWKGSSGPGQAPVV
jgi:hypothetical protein